MFNISIETWADLDVDQIWPNGDAPENPTAADVVAVLESCGRNPLRVLDEWGILDYPTVTVTGRVDKNVDIAHAWEPPWKRGIVDPG